MFTFLQYSTNWLQYILYDGLPKVYLIRILYILQMCLDCDSEEILVILKHPVDQAGSHQYTSAYFRDEDSTQVIVKHVHGT